MPSTVVDVTAIDEDGSWTLLRDGALPADEIGLLLGRRSSG